MPSHSADETLERLPFRPPVSFEFSASERECIVHLIGHKLERIEREFILQTLRCKQGNRTLAAKTLGISIRSLRDRIRNYRYRGESVPEPRSPLLECLEEMDKVWRDLAEESVTKS
jgi:transcriptional regulator with GAF, ATPase, and Fis domain